MFGENMPSEIIKESADNLGQKLSYSWSAASDVGKVREENQDSYLVDAELGLFLISDGMGGHRGGSLASRIIVEDLPVMIETGLNKIRSNDPRAIKSLLKKALVEQSRQLRMEGTSEAGFKEMGATLAMALLRNDRAYIANMGDSRLYLFRKGRLSQRTKDHSVVSTLLEQNKIEPEEVENHAAQGQITQYIGMEEETCPYIRTFMIRKGDRLLLCTDGLTDMIDDKVIAIILHNEADLKSVCKSLVNAANAAGGYDNITVMAIDWLNQSLCALNSKN